MSTPAPHFFMSYSRDDIDLQRRIAAELRGRGINVWVDVENLIPGSPAWEREVERSIRAAAGLIVLLSPASNSSEWVRREVSFAEHNDKRIFPVLLSGDEDDSIPLRLSNHQHVDLRSQFDVGMDDLANALQDHLGTTKIIKRKRQEPKESANLPLDLRKFALPGLIALIALTCIAGFALTARFIYTTISGRRTPGVTFTPTVEPFIVATVQNINTNEELAGRIVYTCQVNKTNVSDQICVINADGSGQRQLTNLNSSDNQDASFSPDGESIIFVSNRTGYYEMYEMDLSGNTTPLTNLKSRVGLPSTSSDNQSIVFSNRVNGHDQIWLMDRDGNNARVLFTSTGKSAVAPTWSPSGEEILFALGKDPTDAAKQLFIIDFNGGEPRLLSDKILTPGRTDWSRQDLIAYYMGDGWKRNVWTIYPDGTVMAQVTDGGNAQSLSFSPGGRYITYTAYTNVQGQDEFSCEIFILDLYINESWQLTDNDICDYQPRWGN
jgi:TolB protein